MSEAGRVVIRQRSARRREEIKGKVTREVDGPQRARGEGREDVGGPRVRFEKRYM